ncbi:hypothetical protein Adt_24168 [Abeliophyllum distichum]|uniref:Uncharacterized protein n=1 Tax=Abeliophyllum distichum TaxID=126358 RepID=A0ABD1SCZ4_9LAMI
MGESIGDDPVVARLVEEVTAALGTKPRSAAVWVLFFVVGAEFDSVRLGMGATRVIEGGPSMVKSGFSGFEVGSTIRNLWQWDIEAKAEIGLYTFNCFTYTSG